MESMLEWERLSAYADDELDERRRLRVLEAMAHDRRLRARLLGIEFLRQRVLRHACRHPAPDVLRLRVQARLARCARRRWFPRLRAAWARWRGAHDAST